MPPRIRIHAPGVYTYEATELRAIERTDFVGFERTPELSHAPGVPIVEVRPPSGPVLNAYADITFERTLVQHRGVLGGLPAFSAGSGPYPVTYDPGVYPVGVAENVPLPTVGQTDMTFHGFSYVEDPTDERTRIQPTVAMTERLTTGQFQELREKWVEACLKPPPFPEEARVSRFDREILVEGDEGYQDLPVPEERVEPVTGWSAYSSWKEDE